MDVQENCPKGYTVVANANDIDQLANRSLSGSQIILKDGETIKVEALVRSETAAHTDSNGKPLYSVRLLCSSNLKPVRLLTVAHFNPYPKDRGAWLHKTNFGDDVAAFSGTVAEFVDFLIGKTLTVKAIEKLPCKKHINGVLKDTEAYFHSFEYVE